MNNSMYLETFRLPSAETEEKLLAARAEHNGGYYGYVDNPYPCRLFPPKGLSELCFDKITILYGGNGSGKSTLLNLIAQKTELKRVAPFNSGEMFDSFTRACRYTLGCDDDGDRWRIPNGSRIITSDDIFDYMLTVRTNNSEISENIETAREEWKRLKYGDSVKFTGLEDYEEFRAQVQSRRRSVSRREFVRRTAGSEVRLNSNGETALAYFDSRLKNETLYCLDEPENSLSPKLQLRLAEMIAEAARLCGCQFIIATHSPFLLALKGARIYDLDTAPVEVREWYELENTRLYFDFFEKNRALFVQ